MDGFGNGKRQMALAWGVAFFFFTAGHANALTRPSLAAPSNDATVQSLPVFSWSPVSGAAKYEVQIASDSSFSSLAPGGDFFTKNTRATLKRAVPDGKLWWRVRASGSGGLVSRWSPSRTIVKSWKTAPTLVYPADGATLTYPANPLRLSWTRVPGTYKYSVTLASDPLLASPLDGFPVLTTATSLTHQPSGLANGETYYWSVTPQDARGNAGSESATGSFHWKWPTTMTPSLADLVGADEVFDPRFAWDLVPGAARYEVEVNSDDTFDTGSVVLDTTTIGSSLAPRPLLPNNTYYWRVRAIDADGAKGVWNEGASFQKSFADETVMARSSVTNLRMDYRDDDTGTAGYQTTIPIVAWDAVPGAAAYDVEVGSWSGASCSYNSPLKAVTATTAWTPLGSSPTGDPYTTPTAPLLANDSFVALVPDQYCVRVRPRDGSDFSTGDSDAKVVGTWTEVNPGGFSFDWTGYPSGSACSPSCNAGYLGASDYLTPVKGTTVGEMPVFRWNPIAGAQSYFVVVARDSAFTTIVDHAFTRVPAYAPRRAASSSLTRTYSDETTKYYWVVLPSPNLNGSAAAFDPLQGAASNFLKQTTPPTLLAPAEGAKTSGWPSFRWTPVDGARVYEIQVDDAATFASPLDDKKTNSTAYTSESTYPADKVLYWRVRPLDDEKRALTWSETGTFQRKLPKPVWDDGLPTSGATTPTLTWAPITGAVSYDLDTDKPDGSHKLWSDLRSAALTYVTFYGTGVFGQRVRANFPSVTNGVVTHGPWSSTFDFTRTIPAPANASAHVSKGGISLSWSPRAEAREYRVQISKTKDFSQPLETTSTDNTKLAPLMMTYGYLAGGTFYWRVATVDEGRNVGSYTGAHTFKTPKGMKLSALGAPVKHKRVKVELTVRRMSNNKSVRRVRVHLKGAGIHTRWKRTHSNGTVTFRVRARRKGTVHATAKKSGYQTAKLGLRVR